MSSSDHTGCLAVGFNRVSNHTSRRAAPSKAGLAMPHPVTIATPLVGLVVEPVGVLNVVGAAFTMLRSSIGGHF